MIFDDKSLFKPWNGWLRISANLHFIFTLLVALTLPIELEYQVGSMAIALLFLNWLAGGRYVKKLRNLTNYKSGMLVFLFFLLHLTGLLYTSDMAEGWFDIERKLSLFVLPLVLFSSPLTVQQKDFVLCAFLVFCLILACTGLWFGILHFIEITFFKGTEHIVTFLLGIHRVYFSIYLLLGYFIAFYFYRKYCSGASPVVKLSVMLCAALTAAMILIMASRVAIIILLFTTAAILLYFTVIRDKQYVRAGVLLGAGILLLVLVFTRVTYIKVFMSDLVHNFDKKKTGTVSSVNLRVEKYKCAVQAIRQHWVAGVGTGDVQSTLNQFYRSNNFYEGYKFNLDAHNQFFQTWIGLGLPGILTFAALLLFSLISAIKEQNFLLAYFIVIFSVCCISESLLTTQKGIIFFALFFPMLYSNRNNLSALYSPLTR